MISKNRRLSTKDLKQIRGGQTYFSENFSTRIINSNGVSKFAVVISKKIAKTAVVRNRLRRRTYNIIQKVLKEITPNNLIIIYIKKNFETVSPSYIFIEIRKILEKSKVIK